MEIIIGIRQGAGALPTPDKGCGYPALGRKQSSMDCQASGGLTATGSAFYPGRAG